MLASSTDALPTGDGLGVRAEVGRVQGARDASTAETSTFGAETATTSRPVSLPSRARSASQSARRRPCSTARSAPSTRPAARGSGCCRQGAGTLVFVAFDVLERGRRAARSTVPTRAARRARAARRPVRQRVFWSLRRSTTAPPSSVPHETTASRASSPSSPTRRTGPGVARRDWRKLKLKHRQELVIAGFTRGAGPPRERDRRARARRPRRPTASATREMSAPASPTASSIASSALLQPLRRETTPFAEVPKMPQVRARDVTWVEPSSSRRSSSPSGRARAVARARVPRPA